MTISIQTNWEVRPTNGSNTNGGGYAWGGGASKSTPTDLVIDGSNSAIVSSSAYGFTSADVGRYIKITAGTGFIFGYYYIISVSSGNATLDRSAGTVSSTGGSVTIYYGIDYSRQNAVNANGGANGSSVLGVTNGTTTIVVADAQFNEDIVGNVIYVAGGTGSVVAAWYQVITFTNSTTIVVDRSTGLTAGTGVTVNIGGALQTLAQVATNYLGGNRIWVKAEATITTATGIAFATSFAGTTAAFTMMSGYTTTRGDGGYVTVQLTSAVANGPLQITGNNFFLENFICDANSQTTSTGLYFNTNRCIAYNCKAMNATNHGIFFESLAGAIMYCEATACTGTTGISLLIDNGVIVYRNYVHDNALTGTAAGIFVTSGTGTSVVENIVYNNSGSTTDGVSIVSITNPCTIVYGNTIDASGRHGINISGSTLPGIVLQNNIISNSGHSTGTNAATAYGLNGQLTTNVASPWIPFIDGNAYYNNLSGNYNNVADEGINNAGAGSTPFRKVNDVILTQSPFTSQGTDFSLNSTSGGGVAAISTGQPQTWLNLGGTEGSPSFGAVQPIGAATFPTVSFGG